MLLPLRFCLFSYIIHPFLIYFVKANCLNNLNHSLYIYILTRKKTKNARKLCEMQLVCTPSLPSEILLYINRKAEYHLSSYPSLPSEILLYINVRWALFPVLFPSLPYEFMLYINLNQWHYRLLINFNLVTNDKGMI